MKRKSKRIEKDMNGDLVELSLSCSAVSQPEWDEVVEDGIFTGNEHDTINTCRVGLRKLFYKYLGVGCYDIPVRIKCRDGAILIERIQKGVK